MMHCPAMLKTTFFRAFVTLSLLLGCAMALSACSDGAAGPKSSRDARSGMVRIAAEEESDFGLGGEDGVTGSSTRGAAGASTSGSKSAGSASVSGGGGPWSIVLRTFSREDHAASAAASLNQVRSLSPLAAAARVEQLADGSAIVVGRYQNPSDADAQRDLKRIKAFMIGTSRPFALAMLTRVGPIAKVESPFDLSHLRAKYPKVDPLYTLQVAIWGNFDNDKMPLEEVRKRAEEYCTKLRAQGYEAYVHHNDATGMSKVTVGAFDRSAVDPASRLASPELEALMKKFPQHLINGEPVQEANVAKFPKKYGYRTQKPQLVEVPK